MDLITRLLDRRPPGKHRKRLPEEMPRQCPECGGTMWPIVQCYGLEMCLACADEVIAAEPEGA